MKRIDIVAISLISIIGLSGCSEKKEEAPAPAPVETEIDSAEQYQKLVKKRELLISQLKIPEKTNAEDMKFISPPKDNCVQNGGSRDKDKQCFASFENAKKICDSIPNTRLPSGTELSLLHSYCNIVDESEPEYEQFVDCMNHKGFSKLGYWIVDSEYISSGSLMSFATFGDRSGNAALFGDHSTFKISKDATYIKCIEK